MQTSSPTNSGLDYATHQLATKCFGYGRWDAPYWFIGPEQGQGLLERDSFQNRHRAFDEIGAYGLCDCRAFHAFIGEVRWHRDSRPPLQPTWRRLLLTLMTFCGESTDHTSLRNYQREHLGRSDGETCLIELSGLPANSFKVPRDRESFREARIQHIQQKLLAAPPVFVVMYGKGNHKHWDRIAAAFSESDRTIAVVAPHPVARGSHDTDWIELGHRLRAQIDQRAGRQ